MSFIFLICTERSGSNLITSIMNGHREISGPPPSHMFRLFGLNCQNYHPTQNNTNWEAFLADFENAKKNMIGVWDSKTDVDNLSEACPNKKISDALNYLYRSERKVGEHISFVKENYTYLIIPFILSNWPDAKFIFQVRDPRDVAASWLKTTLKHGGVELAIQHWKQDQVETLKIFTQIQSSNRAMLVRYEDLIQNTEGITRKICRFIDLEYDNAMLEFYKNQRTRTNANRISAWNNLDKPVIKNNSGKYKKALTKFDIRYIELTCGKEMKIFDYPFESDINALSSAQIAKEISQLKDKVSKGIDINSQSKTEQSVISKRLALIEKVKSRVAVK